MALVEGNVLINDFANGIKLVCGKAAGRHLDADHVELGLALPVDASD